MSLEHLALPEPKEMKREGLSLAKAEHLNIETLKIVMIHKPLKKEEIMSPY